MRYFLLVAFLVLVGGGVYIYSNLPIPVLAGDLAPDFQLLDTNGNTVTLTALRGKVVIVNFWATWCPSCKQEKPSMERLNKMMADENFVMLAVNTDENGPSIVPDFLKRNPLDMTVLYDAQGTVKQQYGVYKLPESFIIDKNGIVDQKIIGPLDWSSPQTIAYFQRLIRG